MKAYTDKPKKFEKQGKISTKSVHITDIPFGAKDSELFEESITIPDDCYAYIDNDKVIIKRRGKSKFKVGEWVIHQGTENIYQVVAVIGNQYQLKYGDNYTVQNCADVDRCARLWDVTKDAKDGDVLYCESGNIEYFVMNKGVNENGDIDSYFRYNTLNDFGVDIPSVLSAKCDNITPATKEQRELLFKKMKEAGYEWDEEKKELKHYEKD